MAVAATERPSEEGEQVGLNASAIGFVGALVIGLASTAPERVTGGDVTGAREAGVEAEAVIVHERPVAALLDLADERDARMIVIGTHGEGPIRGAILGSTPHKLLQHSGRPVLVVPAPDHEREGSDGR